jgi:hypothetical protein
MRSLLTLSAVAIMGVLSACTLKWTSPDVYSLRGLGEPKCQQTTSTDAMRSDCVAQIKRYHEEYDSMLNAKPVSLKGALTEDDALCYKNPSAGEKACATHVPTGK